MLKRTEDAELMVNEWHREFGLLEPVLLFMASERCKRKSIFAPYIAEIREELKTIYYELLLSILCWNTLSYVGWEDPKGPKTLKLMNGLIPYARTTALVEDVNLRTGALDDVINHLGNKKLRGNRE